jgi:DnaJ-class molecular chaperone
MADTRPPITCTSCGGDGLLHYSESYRGGKARHMIDRDEPCWTCGGTGMIYDGMVNMNGDSMYDIILKEVQHV